MNGISPNPCAVTLGGASICGGYRRDAASLAASRVASAATGQLSQMGAGMPAAFSSLSSSRSSSGPAAIVSSGPSPLPFTDQRKRGIGSQDLSRRNGPLGMTLRALPPRSYQNWSSSDESDSAPVEKPQRSNVPEGPMAKRQKVLVSVAASKPVDETSDEAKLRRNAASAARYRHRQELKLNNLEREVGDLKIELGRLAADAERVEKAIKANMAAIAKFDIEIARLTR